MALTPGQKKILHELAEQLDAVSTPGGDKDRLLARACQTLGASRPTIYRWLKSVTGWTSGRKTRSDCGKSCVDEDTACKAAGLALLSHRKRDKDMLSLTRVRTVLEEQEGAPALPSVSTLARAMKNVGVHPGQLRRGKPTGRVRTLYPNHTWQVDASVCVLYRLTDKGMDVLDEALYNERKPKNLSEIANERIIRYVVTDHTSGFFVLHYERAQGEDAQGVLKALIKAMTDRGPQDPMHGVPEQIYMDQGSANRSGLIKDFCERLGIRAMYHAPKSASATGSVERMQGLVEREFEARLRFCTINSLDELQADADRWRAHYCARQVHRRTGRSRSAAWLLIPDESLKTVDADVLQAIAHWQLETRTVGPDMCIQVKTRLKAYGTQKYDLRDLAYHGLGIGDKVRVELNPFKVPDITVIKTQPDGSELRFDVSPIQLDAWGQDISAPVLGQAYKSVPDTVTDEKLKKIKRDAYGVRTDEEADKAQRAGKKAYAEIDIMADVKDAPTYLRRQGSPADVQAAQMTIPPMSRVAFALKMRREHPEVWRDVNASDCMAYVAKRYGDTIPGEALEELVQAMTRLFAPRTITLNIKEAVG